jgi:uracil-DNA glycosylase
VRFMNTFCPEIWPEDPTPISQRSCEKCGLYKQGSRMVWGEGNPEAPIMIILDNPGAREDQDGNSFVCGTRETLQKVAYEAELKKEDLYVTYILKRRPLRQYNKEKTREICMLHLMEQLNIHKPELLVCLGNVAVQSFFQNPELDVKGLRGSWHRVNGYRVTVAYHPLAARRRPNLYSLLLEDMQFVSAEFHKIRK